MQDLDLATMVIKWLICRMDIILQIHSKAVFEDVNLKE